MLKFSNLSLLLLFGLLIGFTACEEDPDDGPGLPSDDETCDDISSTVRDFYEADAIRLAINLIEAQGGPASETVFVPPALQEQMSDILGAVHSSEFAARDSVVEYYDVHIYERYSLDRILLEVQADSSDSSSLWVNQWTEGNRLTGNSDVDGLMVTYDLEVAEFYNLSNTTVVFLESADEINVFALANKFTGINGINSATVESLPGDGNDIVVEAVGDDEYKVVYGVGQEDCENTCELRRFYEFLVGDNCTVQYVNTYGDTLEE